MSQRLKTTEHANSSPQTVNNAHSSVLPPPPHLSRSVAETDGDVSLGSFVATIKGIPFRLNQSYPKNIRGKNLTASKTNTWTEKGGE